jgi:hypothetical protein
VNAKDRKEYRPLGCPQPRELGAMGEEEREERRLTIKKLRELVEKADKGDGEAASGVREILGESPELAWDCLDLAWETQERLIGRFASDEALARKAAMRRQVGCMREELARGDAPPLERLLADRVVVTWLELQLFESLYAHFMDDLKIAQGEFHQKRIDRAHKRHLSAIRTLAQISKMGPALQINIAEKQVNTAG